MLVFEQGMSGDGWGYYAITESIVADGDFNLDNNIYGVYNGLTKDNQTGRWLTQYPPGTSILDAPFFYAATKTAQKLNLQFEPLTLPETSSVKQLPPSAIPGIVGVILAHNFYALAGLLFIFFTLRINGFSSVSSALIVFAGYLASPLHFYGQSGMSHAGSFCILSVILWLFARIVRSHKIWIWFWIGLLCALATAVRLPNAVMACIAFLAILYMSIDRKIKSIFLLASGFVCLIWIIPLFYFFHAGQFGSSYSGSFFFDRAPLINILFSTQRGFMVFHPFFLLVIPGIIFYIASKKFSSDSKIVATFAFFSAIILSAIYGYYGEWWGSGSYSQRYLTDVTGLFIVCLASVYKSKKIVKFSVIAFTVATILFSYGLFIVSISRTIDFPNGDIWTLNIFDFKYLFEQNITGKDIITGLKNNVYGIKGLIYLLKRI